MEALIREAERRFRSTGDYKAWVRYCELLVRAGYEDPRAVEDATIWDDIQDYHDDLWWHASTARKCGLWGRRNFGDVGFRSSVFKAHHHWGHKGYYDGNNSKRKTLRTHRESKRKSKEYQLPKERRPRDESERARRRRKRFGGREHRYNRRWEQNPQTGYWRIVYSFSAPNLDE